MKKCDRVDLPQLKCGGEEVSEQEELGFEFALRTEVLLPLRLWYNSDLLGTLSYVRLTHVADKMIVRSCMLALYLFAAVLRMRLPQLVGRQREIVYLAAEGHNVVLGTAGCGKTSMAIVRSSHLQQYCTDPGDKSLLVTFNKMLVTYMKEIAGDLPSGLDVENYHKVARGFLYSRGRIGYDDILKKELRSQLIQRALGEERETRGDAILRRDVEFFVEETRWIEQFGIVDLPAY